MLEGMIDAGCKAKSWWTARPAKTLDGFVKRFPDLLRVDNYSDILNDPEIDMVLIADIPVERAELAIKAMEAGKDVMVDKPGCTTLEQLAQIQETVARTNRIWSVDFSERFEVPAVIKAAELIAKGAIGKVIQTVGLGPHRINKHLRDDWFFDPEQYGGILADIGSHQIDQFLFFTGSTTADIVTSTVGNYANPDHPKLEDFGEILLRNENGHAYIRLDWYTPDALPNWGDGRLTILGTEGYIELRKYVDVAGREGTDHLYLVNGTRYEHIDCSDIPLTYFKNLADDVRNRTETAMAQSHAFEVTRLAIAAQLKATRVGNLAE
ncbi:MAG: Gfo/Idh/MocA family oxidoreductase [Rhizobiaceae bacterium]|nr:Gfo/Idh/MocA family oxidoreductase [Rhizobiaceae bacterium]